MHKLTAVAMQDPTPPKRPPSKPDDSSAILTIVAVIVAAAVARLVSRKHARKRILSAIQAWSPKPGVGELKDHQHLEEHLRAALPSAYIEREYRDAGTTTDLFIRLPGLLGARAELYVETKRDLEEKPEYDRLVGQVEGLNPRERHVCVVFAGDCDRQFVQRFREHYSEKVGSGDFNLHVVDKSSA